MAQILARSQDSLVIDACHSSAIFWIHLYCLWSTPVKQQESHDLGFSYVNSERLN